MEQGIEPGAVFGGRYTIENQIGAGGMGRVFRAWDESLKREVRRPCALERTERESGSHAGCDAE